MSTYAQRVGDRLRNIRKQKGMSLQEVEAISQHEFKASVLGAYERGERSISVPRLQKLAEFYDVPPEQLLPPEMTVSRRGPASHDGGVTLDLTRLQELRESELEAIGRYCGMIQVQRQDFNGKMLTIRRDDLRALACLYEMSGDELEDRLDGLGVTVQKG